ADAHQKFNWKFLNEENIVVDYVLRYSMRFSACFSILPDCQMSMSELVTLSSLLILRFLWFSMGCGGTKETKSDSTRGSRGSGPNTANRGSNDTEPSMR